mmetsp:Transcript_17774/g.36407  ORF Transcript_17774/g.36407 Transcript_17774/m.36407 type:complete len:536 (+) Transcript_17774:114-1721(+)
MAGAVVVAVVELAPEFAFSSRQGPCCLKLACEMACIHASISSSEFAPSFSFVFPTLTVKWFGFESALTATFSTLPPPSPPFKPDTFQLLDALPFPPPNAAMVSTPPADKVKRCSFPSLTSIPASTSALKPVESELGKLEPRPKSPPPAAPAPEEGEEDEDEEQEQLKEYQTKYLPGTGEVAQWEEAEVELDENDILDIGDGDGDDDEDKEKGEDGKEKSLKGWLGGTAVGSFLANITGNKVLEEADLLPILESMRHQLMAKNVASEIADGICGSVKQHLEGQSLQSFTSVKSAVVAALKEAVLRVLTPRKSTDLLHAIRSHKGSGTPFVVCFVGINGVGKSTTLAKVGYFLKSQGVKISLAACDTFRSGAVEQLRNHARCLDVPLFEKGYLKDPGEVARQAIAEAQASGLDCVLVDTAGRMQNNEKLMKELAKLVQVNKPNMLLFVGEALVGNDGIDQLTMFNKALATYLPSGASTGIDGIVLTKFDTIDDKVGATLSMTYKTGQPVMFVGTGQKYTHLKKLNVNDVIRSLFSKV